MSEPDPFAPARRRFVDPAYRPVCATLAEVRAGIDAIDVRMVELLAQRAALVMEATRFKRDAGEAAAPARQAQVFERVRELARGERCAFPGLPEVAEATWRAMVAAFVAREQALLAATEPVPTDESSTPSKSPASPASPVPGALAAGTSDDHRARAPRGAPPTGDRSP